MLLQRVQAEPDRQAFVGAFSPEKEVSVNEDFRLNFSVPSIPAPSYSYRPTSTSISLHRRNKAPLTAARRSWCSLPWPRSGHINGAYDVWMSVWTSNGSGRSPAAERFLLHFELKMTPMICEFVVDPVAGKQCIPAWDA